MNLKEELIYTISRITEIRESKGWSIQELGDHANIERSNMSRIESGKVDIRYSTLCRIADALGVTVKDLVR